MQEDDGHLDQWTDIPIFTDTITGRKRCWGKDAHSNNTTVMAIVMISLVDVQYHRKCSTSYCFRGPKGIQLTDIISGFYSILT